MGRNDMRFFRTHPEDERVQQSLRIFSILKKNDKVTKNDVVNRTGLSDGIVKQYMESYGRKGLVEIADHGEGEIISLSKGGKKVLGAGFSHGVCFLTVLSIEGKVESQERIELDVFRNDELKRKEMKKILSQIEEGTSLKGVDFHAAGIALRENIERAKVNDVNFFISEMSRIFSCRFFIARETTAAGYGERDFGGESDGRDILFMHLDAGAGVIVKDEIIFEADEGDADRAYLRPWNQFSIALTARNLIDKGIGTNIVDIVHGDISAITLEVVLAAASSGDEVAQDLVRRSALALGMRAAYLINMFTPKIVILGGGEKEGNEDFTEYVREGAKKFLLEGLSEKMKIVFGSLKNGAGSFGAGGLCRRELFMEV